jgi:hypothetical protein
MQGRAPNPTHGGTGTGHRIVGQPKVAHGDQTLASVDERQAVTHPGYDTFLLK